MILSMFWYWAVYALTTCGGACFILFWKKKKPQRFSQCITDLLAVFSLNSRYSSFSWRKLYNHLEENISLWFNAKVDQTGLYKSTWTQQEIAVDASTQRFSFLHKDKQYRVNLDLKISPVSWRDSLWAESVFNQCFTPSLKILKFLMKWFARKHLKNLKKRPWSGGFNSCSVKLKCRGYTVLR